MKILPFKIPKTTAESFVVQEDHQPYFYDLLHQHPELQLTVILEGNGTLFLGDYVGEFTEDEIYVIGSNVPHVFKSDQSYYDNDSKLHCHSLSIFFDESSFGSNFFQLPEMLEVKEFIATAARGIKVTCSKRQLIKQQIISLLSLKGIDRLLGFLKIIKDLTASDCEYIFLGMEQPTTMVNELDGKRLNQIIQFSSREYNRNISLEEIAEIANMTPTSFCRFFKQRTRKSYINFLNELRISKSLKLLMNKDISIVEICYQVGFNNLSNFNRRFKQVTGYSPSNYRKKHFNI